MDTINLAAGLNKRGNKALYSGDMVNAIYCFRRALFLDAGNIEYIIDLMFALNQLAHFDESMELGYAAIGMNDPSADLSVLYFLIAEALIGLNYFDCCIKMLEASLDQNKEGPCSQEARQMLDDLHQNIDFTESESESYQQYSALAEAEMKLQRGDSDGCNGILEDKSELFEEQPIYYLMHINSLIQEGKLEKALETAVFAVKNGMDITPVLCYGVMLAVKLDDRKQLDYFRSLMEDIDDCDVEDIGMLADALSILDHNKTAYTVFKRLYADNKFNKQVIFGFAIACIRTGEVNHGKELLQTLDLLEGGDAVAAVFLQSMASSADETYPSDDMTYMYEYTDDYAEPGWNKLLDCSTDELTDMLEKDKAFLNLTMWLIKNQEESAAEHILQKIPFHQPNQRLALRMIAVSLSVPLLTRLNAAEVVSREDAGKEVFVHTGSDFVPYSMELHQVVRQIYLQEKNDTAKDHMQ